VQGRQLDELLETLRDRVVDDRGLSELRPAVDDAVRDGGDVAGRLGERRDGLRGSVRGDERELQARGARVDDENRVVQ
jgi:hypothetical protein